MVAWRHLVGHVHHHETKVFRALTGFLPSARAISDARAFPGKSVFLCAALAALRPGNPVKRPGAVPIRTGSAPPARKCRRFFSPARIATACTNPLFSAPPFSLGRAARAAPEARPWLARGCRFWTPGGFWGYPYPTRPEIVAPGAIVSVFFAAPAKNGLFPPPGPFSPRAARASTNPPSLLPGVWWTRPPRSPWPPTQSVTREGGGGSLRTPPPPSSRVSGQILLGQARRRCREPKRPNRRRAGRCCGLARLAWMGQAARSARAAERACGAPLVGRRATWRQAQGRRSFGRRAANIARPGLVASAQHHTSAVI